MSKELLAFVYGDNPLLDRAKALLDNHGLLMNEQFAPAAQSMLDQLERKANEIGEVRKKIETLVKARPV